MLPVVPDSEDIMAFLTLRGGLLSLVKLCYIWVPAMKLFRLLELLLGGDFSLSIWILARRAL